ncbi:MAG: FecR domain-containing protein [Candidatus Omnitrophica bacterium]|nr:FecR domain-containing protein [Candidatus Omnitrophota bacterium]
MVTKIKFIMGLIAILVIFCFAGDNPVVLVDRSGSVYYWNTSAGRWDDLPVKSRLGEGTFVKVDAGSKAVISFGKKAVITLSENTAIRIERSLFDEKDEIKEIKVQLPKGKIWSVVEKLPSEERKFNIETPNTIAGVRGTIFSTNYNQQYNSTTVGVVAGEVGVASTKTPGYVILKENMSTVVIANKPPVSPQALEEKEKQEWEGWKNSIPFSEIGIVGGIAEINAMQIQEAARVVRELGIAKKGSEKVTKDFEAIENAIKLFYADTKTVPSKLEDLMKNPGVDDWNGPYLGAGTTFIDPYGRPYQYKRKTTPGGKEYLELSTFGLIGAAGDTYGEEKKVIFIDKLKESL